MANGRTWTTRECNTLRFMREEGAPLREIANAIGRSISAVKSKSHYIRRAPHAGQTHDRDD